MPGRILNRELKPCRKVFFSLLCSGCSLLSMVSPKLCRLVEELKTVTQVLSALSMSLPDAWDGTYIKNQLFLDLIKII